MTSTGAHARVIEERVATVVAFTLAILCVNAGRAEAAHSADAFVTHDAVYSGFVGTSNPAPLANEKIFIGNGVPGYLNAISGPQTSGVVIANDLGPGTTYFAGVAIHIADNAGPSHSLSQLNDPALADLVLDLSQLSARDSPLATFAFGNAPSQYAPEIAALTAGESANGGQPFDLLFVGTDSSGVRLAKYWSFDFSHEVGNLDGITALNFTDIGIVPEPTGLAVLGILTAPALLARRRRK
jgi:hypothetical protein